MKQTAVVLLCIVLGVFAYLRVEPWSKAQNKAWHARCEPEGVWIATGRSSFTCFRKDAVINTEEPK